MYLCCHTQNVYEAFLRHSVQPVRLTQIHFTPRSAKITLNNLPQGSTVLRARSGHLEIIVSRDDASATCDRHRPVATSHGVIDLPVYVNAASLRFFVDESTNLLYMVGETKGSNSQPSVDGSHQCTRRRSTWSAERPKVAAYKATVK